jgi:hypothetical protein
MWLPFPQLLAGKPANVRTQAMADAVHSWRLNSKKNRKKLALKYYSHFYKWKHLLIVHAEKFIGQSLQHSGESNTHIASIGGSLQNKPIW